MHGHECLGRIDECQAILYGMETGGTTIGNAVGHCKLILLAELLPIGLMVAREHKDNLYGMVTRVEGVERVHQHRTPSHWDKLLGQLSTHAEAFTSSYDNGVLFHLKLHSFS